MDAPLLPGSCPRRLAAISHQPPTLLTAVSGLFLDVVVLFIRDKEVEGIVEEKVKDKGHGGSVRHFTAGTEKDHRFVRRFHGLIRSFVYLSRV
jgi:hypothetical protein